jgi:hypothetical protein
MSILKPIVDLHAHLPMQLRLPRRPCDSEFQTIRNQLLMDTANHAANFGGPRPRFRLGGAKSAGVSFGSVAYVPSDEFFGPCGAISNLLAQLEDTTAKIRSAGYNLEISGKDFATRVCSGGLAAFNCLEGGFSVEEPKNVKALAERGVAMDCGFGRLH